MKKNFIFSAVLLILGLLVFTGCSVQRPAFVDQLIEKIKTDKPTVQKPVAITDDKDPVIDETDKTGIKKFKNLEELKAFLAKSQANLETGLSYGRNTLNKSALAVPMAGEAMGLGDESMAMDTAEASQENVAAPSETDFSKTNIQIEGVDEADIIKTDGNYIYIVAGKELIIVDVRKEADGDIISRVKLQAEPRDIFIKGNKLAVFGSDYEFQPLAKENGQAGQGSTAAAGAVLEKSTVSNSGLIVSDNEVRSIMPRRQNAVFLKVYDLSDHQNPKLVRDLAFDGDYTDSRLIGDYIYFITSEYKYDFDDVILPMVYDRGTALVESSPSVYYFDMPYRSHSFVRVATINLADDNTAPASDVYLLQDAQNIFVSEKNLFITYTEYLDEQQLMMQAVKELTLSRLSSEDQAKIAKIEATDDFILSQEEKLYKIFNLIENYFRTLSDEEQVKAEKDLAEALKQHYKEKFRELEKTVIHKIGIENGALSYKGFGEVVGTVLNRFAMDESAGYFRIATTRSRSWSDYMPEEEKEPYSNLYVLDDGMKVVGSLEYLARGERIYSARFMGNRAYLVTFEQTDPLFAIDLSQATAPKVLGELKIPGFSTYLHPYDENTLIGLGHDTQTNEWGGVITAGLKLALFDVAEVGAPKELANYQIGDRGSDSEALNEPHAFTFLKEKNLLVIPASIREASNSRDWGKFVFSGALVFDLTDKKIALRGKIDHSDGGINGENMDWYGYNFYDNTVRRSLYVGENLYTLSGKYLKANKLSDLSAVKSIRLSTIIPTRPAPEPAPSGPEPVRDDLMIQEPVDTQDQAGGAAGADIGSLKD